MKILSISLKRTLDVKMKDNVFRIKQLDEKDSQELREEYKEWVEAIECVNKQPHVLYVNQLNPKIKTFIKKGLNLPLDNLLQLEFTCSFRALKQLKVLPRLLTLVLSIHPYHYFPLFLEK